MMTNNEIQYKAYRFRMEANKTTFAYEVKRVRALWDPTLSIPGTGRRGGWRCPVGTRYGGQITDRFGRNCGWGVARRIANAITNVGERLENVDDRRRGRRVSKRNRRMLGRLQRNAEAGRAERGLRSIAERLDGGEGTTAETLTPSGVPDASPDLPDATPEDVTPPTKPRRVRNPRKPRGQLGRGWRGVLDPNGRRYWERDNRGWFDGSDGEVDATPDGTPTRPGAGRRGEREVVMEDDFGDRVGPDGRGREVIEEGEVEKPKRPRRRKRTVVMEDDFGDRIGPGGRGRDLIEDIYGPDYDPPKKDGDIDGEIVNRNGKPYVWKANPKANYIGAGPQEKGQWYPATNSDIERWRIDQKRKKNWDGKKPAGAPTPPEGRQIYKWIDKDGDEWDYDPREDRWSLVGNAKRRREAEAKDKEQQRQDNERRIRREEERRRRERGEPEAEAEAAPDDGGPPFDSDARDAGLRESERRRVRREIEEPGAPRTEEGATPQAEKKPQPRKPRKRRVQASDQRAQESATRKPAGDVAPAGTQKKPTERIDLTEEMVELDLAPGESAPDERSFRNVNNRFPKNGLPKSAYWRDASYDGNDKFELERRFGRYYGGDNALNNRGKVVNQELKRRRDAGEIKPPRGGKKPPKPEAEKPQFDLPSEPPLPPFFPGTELDNEVKKAMKALDDLKQIAQDIDREEKDFPNLFERPWWRDPQGNGLTDDDRAKIEAALGKFYGKDGKLNPRGRQVYNQIAELRKNDAPKAPQPDAQNDSPISKANSADELINAIGMGWRQLDEKERDIIRKEFERADAANERINKPMDDAKLRNIRNAEDADKAIQVEKNIILDHQKHIEKIMKPLRRGRTTRGAAVGEAKKNDELAAVARIQHDIQRRRNLIAQIEKKKQDGLPTKAPTPEEVKVPEATEAGEKIAQDGDAPTPLENIIPQGGELGGETRDQYRQRVKAQAKAKLKDYDKYADDFIGQNGADEIREKANAIREAQARWKDGYDASKALLEAALKKHEGKQLDGLPLQEQAELKRLMKNVDDHAIEINALEKYAEKLEAVAGKTPEPPGAGGDADADFDGLGDMIPAEPSPVRRPYVQRMTNYEDAVKAIHEGGQTATMDDVADEVIVDAMVDDGMIFVGRKDYVRNDEPLTKEDLQTKGFSHFLFEGGEMENRRFTFKLIKSDGNEDPVEGQGVWDVVKVRDKKTGETWFLKAAVFGHNGAMLEGIGMRAAEALQLGNDRAHLRIGAPIVDEATGKTHRWMMMRGIMDWDHPKGMRPQQEWKDVKRMDYGDAEKISPEDAARIAVLDFVFKNNDRHGGNFMFTKDENGNVRLGLIDHGLIGYGRGFGGVDERAPNPPSKEQWDAEVAKHKRKLDRAGVAGYQGEFNNGIQGLLNLGFQHQDVASRERFARIVQRSVRVLEKQLQTILSQQELQRAGMKLTPAEIAHLDAVRTIITARLEYLRQHQQDLVKAFN